MPGCLISGLKESVFTSTRGLSVLLDTTFCQPVNCNEPGIKSAPVTSESGRIPNVFPTSVIQDYPLRPTFARDVRTHRKEDFYLHVLRDSPVVTLSPLSVFHYMDWYPTFFDLALFHHMPRMAKNCPCRTVFGERLNTALIDLAKY